MKYIWRYFYWLTKHRELVSWVFLLNGIYYGWVGDHTDSLLTFLVAWSFRWEWLWGDEEWFKEKAGK